MADGFQFAFTPAVDAATQPAWEKVKRHVTPLEWRLHAPLIAEINRLKAVSRIGMGRCQGRVCAAAAAELLAAASGRNIAAVGRLRAQPPVKPLPIGLVQHDGREAAE